MDAVELDRRRRASTSAGPRLRELARGRATTSAGATPSSRASSSALGQAGSSGTATAPSFIRRVQQHDVVRAMARSTSATRSPAARRPARRAGAPRPRRAPLELGEGERARRRAISAGRSGTRVGRGPREPVVELHRLIRCCAVGRFVSSTGGGMAFGWTASGSYKDIRYETGTGDADGHREDHDRAAGGAQRVPAADAVRAVGRVRAGARRPSRSASSS